MIGGSVYKFITIEEYNKKYKKSHPDARVSPDGKEVVISTHDSDISHDDAIKYIKDNWVYNDLDLTKEESPRVQVQ
jgi:hypothetical protein